MKCLDHSDHLLIVILGTEKYTDAEVNTTTPAALP